MRTAIVALLLVSAWGVSVVCRVDNADVALPTDRVLVSVTYSNPSPQPVKVDATFTPLEGIWGDIFEVVGADDVHTPYIGKMARRNLNISGEHVIIPAGDDVTVTVDLTDDYEFGQGVHRITLRNPVIFGNPSHFSVDAHPVVVTISGKAERKVSNFGTTYQNCNSNHQSQINSARSTATSQNNRAISCTGSQSTCSQLQTTWFGTWASSRFSVYQRTYRMIQSHLPKANYYCNPSGCGSNVYAYVYPNDSNSVIYLCALFWNIPAERAETLIHEDSHFNAVASTQDSAYGRQNCQNLARNDPNRAIKNADNICYFAASA